MNLGFSQSFIYAGKSLQILNILICSSDSFAVRMPETRKCASWMFLFVSTALQFPWKKYIVESRDGKCSKNVEMSKCPHTPG